MNAKTSRQAAAILKASDGLRTLKKGTVGHTVALSAVEAALERAVVSRPHEIKLPTRDVARYDPRSRRWTLHDHANHRLRELDEKEVMLIEATIAAIGGKP